MASKEEKITNYITSIIRNSDVANGKMPSDADYLSMLSDIICEFNTDIAIAVLENLEVVFGEDAINEQLHIKVTYGY